MKAKIKLILKSVRQYKKYAILSPLFMIGEALMECALPFIMSMFVDTIENIQTVDDMTRAFFYDNPNFHLGNGIYVSLVGLIITLVLMSLFSLACGILGGVNAAKASVGLATNLRHDLYEKLQTFSFSNIDKFSISSLVTRMTTDVSQVQMAFAMMIRIVVRAPLMMIFSAIMAFISGGLMAFVFVVLIPVVSFGLFMIIRSAMKVFTRIFKKYDLLNASTQENISGMRVVKSYVREEFEKVKFNNASDGITGEFIHGEKLVALNNPLMNTTIHLSNIIIIGLGASLIAKTATLGENPDGTKYIIWGDLSIGQLSSLITYGLQILMSLMMISMIMVMLVLSLEGIRRIGEVLQEEPSIKNCDNPIYEVKDGSIVFENVCFKYSEKAEKDTLENINLDIKSGQFVGIIGSTGSGKSSLINLMSRLYDVSEGVVKISGEDVRNYDIKTLRDAVSVVLQKNVLFSGTIESNLKWGNLDATEEEMMTACKIAQAEEIVNAKPEGLKSKVEQGGANFSGGQKQRLCIARALLKNPKILILDDSTSAVDTKTDKLIRRALKEEVPHITKLVIAQRISSIEDADQIIVMNDGKIDQIGTHEELLKTNEIYQEVYYTQNRVGGDK